MMVEIIQTRTFLDLLNLVESDLKKLLPNIKGALHQIKADFKVAESDSYIRMNQCINDLMILSAIWNVCALIAIRRMISQSAFQMNLRPKLKLRRAMCSMPYKTPPVFCKVWNMPLPMVR